MTTEEERDEVPLFERAARDAGSERGLTPEAVLEADRRRLLAVTYPGPECLEPHEIERILKRGLGTLDQARRVHMQTCQPCAAALGALVGAASPSRAPASDMAAVQDQLSWLSERMTEILTEVKLLRLSMGMSPPWQETSDSSDSVATVGVDDVEKLLRNVLGAGR